MSPRLTLTTPLLIILAACGSKSEGDNGGTVTVTTSNPCLFGKTWSLRSVSNSSGQNRITWTFRVDNRYEWVRTLPAPVQSGTGEYSYSNGVLSVTGYLQRSFRSSGQIPLTFDRNRMSFETDTGATFTFDPPVSCALHLAGPVQVAAGVWQFDLLPDDGGESETLTTGVAVQREHLIRIEGEPTLTGLLADTDTWHVQLSPEFEFEGKFTNAPADRFRGTYLREGRTGVVIGLRRD